MTKIIYILEVINSRSDVYGNRYFSMRITRTSDGRTAHGQISGGESNCTYATKKLAGDDWSAFTTVTQELPIREYNRLVKDWPYLGCTPDEINPKVLAQLDK